MDVGSGTASEVVSGMAVAVGCGDIVASAGSDGVAPVGVVVVVGAIVAVGDGTGPDEHAATATAATMKSGYDILRIDSTFPFL